MSQVGRITGPVLAANLERNGIDLSFKNTSSDTQLLYLDVNTNKLGVNKGVTSYELDVNGSIKSTNLISTTTSNIANFTIQNNELNVLVGDINLNAAQGIQISNFETDNIHISDNTISSFRSNSNIDLAPSTDSGALVRTLNNPNAYGTTANDRFGQAIASDGNLAIVGVKEEDSAGSINAGKAYIFNITTGALVRTLHNPNAYGTSQIDYFGHSVAISGNYAIVGTYSEDDADGINSGKAYIFNVNSVFPLHTLDNPNAYSAGEPGDSWYSANDRFGSSVAISGNYAIVGAYQEDDAGVSGGSGSSSGKVYIYNVTSGALVHTLDNPNAYGTSYDDRFGKSVDMSGNNAIVSAYAEDDAGGGSSGKVYIYNVTSGALVHTLDNPNAYGTSYDDRFGKSVDMSGNNAIVSAYAEDDAGGGSSGKVYIYNVTSGALVHTLDNPNAYRTSSSDYFGWNVAISGNSAIVGAWGEDDAGNNNSGKAYIFNVTSGAFLSTIDNPNSSGAGDNFGFSVAISGNSAIVGALYDGGGKAYIFDVTNNTTEVFSNLEVFGNLDATGNITADGNVTIGNDDTDDVVFNAELSNNIIPNTTDTYNLGSTNKRWNELYTNLLNGTSVSVESIIVEAGGDFSLRQGNIFYVSKNGNDTNTGDSVQAPFLTVKRALQFADASITGPVTIQVFAGDYEEEFPLTVPSNVTVQGLDMRNTIIKPTAATNTNNCFLMNGESTVQNLTIKDFYTGNAFSFVSGCVISTRSPYIQNVTVVTKGSVVSASDPRGFAQGDAGKGALVDGASVTSASEEASMLFHSVTFITPGVDAITMTNGVRVEWLNSFTYFANRGLYAVNGSTGHLSTDGSTTKYGAEVRSIGSANVYGNFGAVADGADTLMYLIQHNFGYIGSGKFLDNDPSRAIQANEVTKANSGTIYFQSVNHFGDFRVGDAFFIDQETGNTSIVLSEAQVDSLNGIVVNSGGETTVINGLKIDTTDFIFAGNLLQTKTKDFNVSSAGTINFTSDVTISQNLTTTGNITIGGSLITLGNEASDTINFNTPFSQNIEPDISGAYNLGSASKKWSKVSATEANFADINFNTNVITTTVSNADLELRASGTGNIYLPTNNVEITNAATIVGDTDLQSANITGAIVQAGNTTISNGAAITGSVHVTGSLTIGAKAQLEDVLIDGNLITTDSVALLHTLDNPTAYGTSEQDRFGNSVAISGNSAIVSAQYEDDAGGSNSGKAYIFNVTTGALVHTLDNPTAYGTSEQDYFGNSVAISGDRAIVSTYLEDDAGGLSSGKAYIFNVTSGALVHTLDNPNAYGTSASDYFGNSVAISGNSAIVGAYREDVAGGSNSGKAYIYNVTTGALLHTLDNPTAYGTSAGDWFGYSVAISGNLAIVGAYLEDDAGGSFSGKAYIFNVTSGALVHTLDNPNAYGTSSGDYFGYSVAISGNSAIVGAYREDDAGGTSSGKAYIFNVTTGALVHTLNNPNAYGTTLNDFFSYSVAISGNLAIVGAYLEDDAGGSNSGKAYIYNVTTGALVHTLDNPNAFSTSASDWFGNSVAISGNSAIVGAYREDDAGGSLSGKAYIFNVLDDNNLDLRANGTGNIVIPNNDVVVSNAMSVNDVTGVNLVVTDAMALNEIISEGQIQVDDNFIATTLSNSDLELRANGNGGIQMLNDISFNQNIVSTTADLNLTSSGNVNITSNSSLLIPVGNDAQQVNTTAGNFRFSNKDNVFEGAAGGGYVGFGGVFSSDRRTTLTAHPSNNIINAVIDTTNVAQVTSTGLTVHGLQTDDINIDANTISTTVSNSDLELTQSGTGKIAITGSDTSFKGSTITNASAGALTISTTGGYTKLSGNTAVVFPNGTTAQRGTLEVPGDTRYNSELAYMEVYNGTEWQSAQGGGDTVTADYMNELISIWAITMG